MPRKGPPGQDAPQDALSPDPGWVCPRGQPARGSAGLRAPDLTGGWSQMRGGEGKGLSYLGMELPADHSLELPGATLWPWPGPSRPAGVAPEGLGWEPAALWGVGRKGQGSCPTPTSLHGPCGNLGPTADQKPLWVPWPLPTGSPSWGLRPPVPGAASTSGASHVLLAHTRAWGVGQTPPLSSKTFGASQSAALGPPVGVQPQPPPG